MANDGWIKAFRKIREHPTWSHDGMFKLLFHCLFEANFKASQYLIPGTTECIAVPRGSFITGREVLLGDLYPSKTADTPTSRTLSRWLHGLEEMQVVKLANVSNRCTMVTVVNYETYQQADDEGCPTDVRPPSDQCPTDVLPVSTSEEGKNVKKVRSRSHGSNFVKPTVEDVTAYCAEQGYGIDPEHFVEKNNTIGWIVGKSRHPMKDWKSAVRTWEKFRLESEKANRKPQQRVPDLDEIIRRGYNPQTGLGE